MALLLMEGWDTYSPAVNWGDANTMLAMARNWDARTWNSAAYAATTTGRPTVSNAVAVGGNFASDATAVAGNLSRTFGAALSTVIVVFSYKPTNTTGNVGHGIVTFLDSAGTEMGHLYLTGSGGQIVYRNSLGATILTTAFAGGIQLNVWYTLEIELLADSTNGSVEIRINASSIASATNVNTTGAALTTGTQTLVIGPQAATAATNAFVMDHLVVMDTTGSVNNNFLGEARISTLLPTGVGTYSEWTPTGSTPNWTCVDEPSMDIDTTYNATSTVNARDTYALADLANPLVTVYGLQASAHVRKDDGATRQAQLLLRVGASDALVGSIATLASDYSTRLLAILDQNPVTVTNWTATELLTLEAGVKLIA